MLAANDLRIGMSARRRKSPDADRRERRYSSRSPPRWRSPPTAMRSDKHTETRLPDRDRDRDRDRERRDDREPERRDDRERERCDNRGRESERRDEREREHRDDRERHAPKRWREGGRWMQMYVGDGIGDSRVENVRDDPRLQKNAAPIVVGGKARNTDSFDPESTFVRPEMRVIVGPKTKVFNKTLKHDDVVVVPEFFCAEDDWEMYYALVEEMRSVQQGGQRDSEWIPWAEGSHLISKNPKGCPTYEKVCARVAEYFAIKEGSQATRFNWYRDSSDWKPFHHDSAAFNPERAKRQNITVGISFGAERELAFLHGTNGSRVYFPQCNGMLFAFGRDVNIKWKHGVNALPKALHNGKGRISIILWGLTHLPIEEPDSPPLIENTFGHPPATRAGGGGGPCRDFANGHCRFGDRCRFSHVLSDRNYERR